MNFPLSASTIAFGFYADVVGVESAPFPPYFLVYILEFPRWRFTPIDFLSPLWNR